MKIFESQINPLFKKATILVIKQLLREIREGDHKLAELKFKKQMLLLELEKE